MTVLAVLGANARKVALEMWRYLPNTLSLLVTFYAIFLTLFLGLEVVGDPAGGRENVRYLIVANAFWFLILVGINSMGFEIANEATRGTLEQLYLAPVPVPLILAARMVATLSIYLVLMMVMVSAAMLTSRTWLHLDLPLVFALLVPTLGGVVGLGFAVGGLALMFKQIQSLLQVLQFLFLGLAFIPLASAPYLEVAPIIKGVDLVRSVTVYGAGFADIGVRDWASLWVNAAVYVLLGLWAFRAAEGRARQRGLLGHY